MNKPQPLYNPWKGKKPTRRAEMTEYLGTHKYLSGSNQNDFDSYAWRVKMWDIVFPSREIEEKAWAFLDVEDAFSDVNWLIHEFEERNPGYSIIREGRNAGYFMLISDNENRYHGLDADVKQSRFEDYTAADLRQRVNLVWDFDKTVFAMVQSFIDYVATHELVEQEIEYVIRRKVMVPVEITND